MLSPRGLASSTVLSLRHYELTSDDPFGERLVLVERSRTDEISIADTTPPDSSLRSTTFRMTPPFVSVEA